MLTSRGSQRTDEQAFSNTRGSAHLIHVGGQGAEEPPLISLPPTAAGQDEGYRGCITTGECKRGRDRARIGRPVLLCMLCTSHALAVAVVAVDQGHHGHKHGVGVLGMGCCHHDTACKARVLAGIAVNATTQHAGRGGGAAAVASGGGEGPGKTGEAAGASYLGNVVFVAHALEPFGVGVDGEHLVKTLERLLG